MAVLCFLLPSRLLLSVPEFHRVHRTTLAGDPEAAMTGHGLTAAPSPDIKECPPKIMQPITAGGELRPAPKVSNY